MAEELRLNLKIGGAVEEGKQVSRLQTEINRLTRATKFYQDKADKLRKAGRQNSQQFKELTQTIGKNKREVEALRTAKTKITQSIRAEQKVVNALDGSYDKLTAETAQLRASLRKMPGAFDKTNKAANKLKNKISQNTTKLKQFDKAMGNSFRNVGNYPKGLSAITSGMAAMAAGVLAAVAVFRGLTRGISNAIEKADEQAQAEAQLAQALGRTSQALLDQAAALQKVTRFGDESIIRGQALLASFTDNEETIQRLTPAILDMAQAFQMNAKDAFAIVAKTIGSSTNALSRYGIEVTGAVGSQERLDTLLGNITDKFEGQAEAALAGAGGFAQFSNIVGDLQEKIGDLLIKGLTPFLRIARNIVTTISDGLIPAQKSEIDILEKNRIALGREMKVLSSGNLSQEAREKLIGEINKKYKDYLPNLIKEKSTLNDIRVMQDQINKSLQTKIITQSLEKELVKILEGQKQAMLALVDAEIQREKLKTPDISDTGARALQAQQQILETAVEINTAIVENTDIRVTEVEDRYKKLAEQAGLSFDKILAAAIGTNKDITNDVIEETDAMKKIREANEQKLVDLQRQFIDIRIVNIKDETERSLAAEDEAFDRQVDQAIQNFAIWKDGRITNKEELDALIIELQVEHEQILDDIRADALTKELDDRQKSYNDAIAAYKTLYLDPKKKAEQDALTESIAILQTWKTATQEVTSVILAFDRRAQSQAVASVEQRYDDEIAAAGDNKERIEVIEQEKAAALQKITKKFHNQAIDIKTASAIALGALEIAQINAKPDVTADTSQTLRTLLTVAAVIRTVAQVATLQSQRMHRGGLLDGPSHAQGGIPAVVSGRRPVELEGNESIINARSTAMYGPLLSSINQAGGGVKFADGFAPPVPGTGIVPGVTIEDIAGLINSQKVFVTETDITDTQDDITSIKKEALIFE